MVAASNYRTFAGKYFLALFVGLCAIGAINLAVDPNGRALLIDQPGFNRNKVALGDSTRAAKAYLLRNCSFNQVIIGSSRSQVGLEPNASTMGAGPIFNAALPGTNTHETQRIVDYLSRWQKPTVVWYGVDFETFGQQLGPLGDYWESPLAEYQRPSTWLSYLFSAATLRASLETVVANLKSGVVSCDGSGFNDMRNASINTGRAFRRTLQDFQVRDFLYGSFVYSEERLAEFQTLLDQLATQGIRTNLYIGPVHAMQLELMAERGLLEPFEKWKRDLVSVVENVNEKLPAEQKIVLWDFTGYNGITTEPVPDEQANQPMSGYFDSSHFRPEVGNLMIDRMLNSGDPEFGSSDFGRILNESTIDTVIKDFRDGRQRYLREQPEAAGKIQMWLKQGTDNNDSEPQQLGQNLIK